MLDVMEAVYVELDARQTSSKFKTVSRREREAAVL